MSTQPHRADRRTTQITAPANTASVGPEGAETYLTNEVFLYRVIGIGASDAGEVVELEDCYLLDVARVPINELHARRLRVVAPAAAVTS